MIDYWWRLVFVHHYIIAYDWLLWVLCIIIVYYCMFIWMMSWFDDLCKLFWMLTSIVIVCISILLQFDVSMIFDVIVIVIGENSRQTLLLRWVGPALALTLSHHLLVFSELWHSISLVQPQRISSAGSQLGIQEICQMLHFLKTWVLIPEDPLPQNLGHG